MQYITTDPVPDCPECGEQTISGIIVDLSAMLLGIVCAECGEVRIMTLTSAMKEE